MNSLNTPEIINTATHPDYKDLPVSYRKQMNNEITRHENKIRRDRDEYVTRMFAKYGVTHPHDMYWVYEMPFIRYIDMRDDSMFKKIISKYLEVLEEGISYNGAIGLSRASAIQAAEATLYGIEQDREFFRQILLIDCFKSASSKACKLLGIGNLGFNNFKNNNNTRRGGGKRRRTRKQQ